MAAWVGVGRGVGRGVGFGRRKGRGERRGRRRGDGQQGCWRRRGWRRGGGDRSRLCRRPRRGGTTAAKLLTTEDLLRNGPAALPICVPCLTIEGQRAGRWLEEQPEQGQEQQQTAEAATNDHARAVPLGPDHLKVATEADVLVGSLLHVAAASIAHIGHRPRTAPSAPTLG